jgi:hypothetical protein
VFAADFAILVAVAIVETCLAHAGSPVCPTADSRQNPPVELKWQLTRARKIMLGGTIRTRRGEGPVHAGGRYFGGGKSPRSQRPRPLDFMGSSYAATRRHMRRR